MSVYFYTGGVQSQELQELETGIRAVVPGLETISDIAEVQRRWAQDDSKARRRLYLIFPVLTPGTSLERLISLAEQDHEGIFFLFVSHDISASDYKRLVRTGGADWVALRDAPREIAELISRETQAEAARESSGVDKPVIATFVPSAGGVGNATLVIETAVQLKHDKQTRDRRICIIDLDVQGSHICDYLDVAARLQPREIVDSPARLDNELFALFVSEHASGLHVIAAPRGRQDASELTMPALDALFGMIAARYDLVMVDLPPVWEAWTPQILGVSDLAVVTGIHTIPGLRQVVDTLSAVRSVSPVPRQVVVGLNRCEPRLLGGIGRAQHVKKILGQETVITIREDASAAIQSVNTGIPASTGTPSSRISKDMRALSALLANLGRQTS